MPKWPGVWTDAEAVKILDAAITVQRGLMMMQAIGYHAPECLDAIDEYIRMLVTGLWIEPELN